MNQPKFYTQRVKIAMFFLFRMKHLEVRVTGNPGTRGRLDHNPPIRELANAMLILLKALGVAP